MKNLRDMTDSEVARLKAEIETRLADILPRGAVIIIAQFKKREDGQEEESEAWLGHVRLGAVVK